MPGFQVNSSFGLPESVDSTHKFIYRSGEYGIYQYWYIGKLGNYWLYTNAPEDSEQYDPTAGPPMLSSEQPLPETAPQFYTAEGFKRNVSVAPELTVTRNPEYHPNDLTNIWFERYSPEGSDKVFYVYIDSDVRENLNLWVQQQLRIVDAGLSKYRKYAAQLLESDIRKDRVIGGLLMLVDQGHYSLNSLVNATVEDIEFINETVKLFGKKFICDPLLLDFLTSLAGTRPPSDPLFVLDTVHGTGPVGIRYLYSIFYATRINPHYLLYWHANHIFSMIVNRLSIQQVPLEVLEERAYAELAATLNTDEDVRFLIDDKVKTVLFMNYEKAVNPVVAKSLGTAVTDSYGTATVWSYLDRKTENEMQFSAWLQLEPLHLISAQEEEAIADIIAREDASEDEEGTEEGEDEAEESEVPDSSESEDAPDAPTPEDQP